MTLRLARTVLAAVLPFLALPPAVAQEPVKVGLILPMTGPFASTGRQVEAGARLYWNQHCQTVAGRPVELIVRDDAAEAASSRRLAQELVVRERVHVLAGFGLTPLAFSAAPVATQSKTPMVVMAAATSSITEKSPYIVRSSFTLPQVAAPMGEWAAANGLKRVVTLVTDYAPGLDAEAWFKKTFEAGGGAVVESLRAPLQNPDFSAFLQRVRDAKPDALFVFVPSGVGSSLMKQFETRGLKEAGIKLIATGDVTDDDILNDMGPAARDTITTHHYSAAHESPENKAYVEAFGAANGGARPNFMSIGGYDGMRLICAALEQTKGNTDGDALLAAMKGMQWESPRGPVAIDPDTRDIVQSVYVRRVEERDGQLYNVEFDRFDKVADPGKAN